MAKLAFIFTLICLSTIIANSKSLFEDNKTIFPFPSPSPSPIRVYLFQVAAGPNATLYEVARSNISTTPVTFGIVYVGDDEIRAGPDPNSQQLGRSQGTVTTTGLYEPSAVVNYNFMFALGKYKGSSLKIAGQRLIFVKDQEIPITGGTGVFRGARGYALSSFISFNPTTTTYVFLFDTPSISYILTPFFLAFLARFSTLLDDGF